MNRFCLSGSRQYFFFFKGIFFSFSFHTFDELIDDSMPSGPTCSLGRYLNLDCTCSPLGFRADQFLVSCIFSECVCVCDG